jgi:predicted secreted Zn-dependent protease
MGGMTVRINRLVPSLVGLIAAAAMIDMRPAQADPSVRETISYYDVSGADAREVRASLDRNGPVSPADGTRHDAYTHWYVSWKYQYRQPKAQCAIASVSTDVKTTITFPRLKTDTTTPESLKSSFGRYVDNLMLHEKGHVQIAIDIARKIETGIRAMPSQSNCDTLQEVANTLGHALLKEANQADVDYDMRTRHGATQGARFP